MSCSIDESPIIGLEKSNLNLVNTTTLTLASPTSNNSTLMLQQNSTNNNSSNGNSNNNNNILTTITNQTSNNNNNTNNNLNGINLVNKNNENDSNSNNNNNNTITINTNSNITLTPVKPAIINTNGLQLNLNNSNSNESNSNNGNQMPAKIVQAGNQYIITTLFPGGSTQKLVTVAAQNLSSSPGNNNNSNNQTISIINSNTNKPLATSSSIGSSSSNNNEKQQNEPITINTNTNNNTQPTTTTITLTSPTILNNALTSSSSSPSSSGGNLASSSATASSTSTSIFPLHDVDHSQFTFIDTSNNNQNNMSNVFSSMTNHSNQSTQNNTYYTYHTTQNFQPQQQQNTIQLTTSNQNSNNNNNNLITTTTQQQQQQPVYMMYQEPQSLEMENVSIEFEGHVSHTAQAAPITVQWLIQNFEPAEGCSLRRSTLYNYYLHHSTEQRLEPVNPASFGKLIRSVFLGLRTRRLGTRGNSKYHYYGIRVKGSSPLNELAEDHAIAIRNHPLSLSPTGSPHPHPTSPINSSPTNNSTNNHAPPSKRIKTNNVNNYEQTTLINNNSNNNNGQTIQMIDQHHHQSFQNGNHQNNTAPMMTVILTNPSNNNKITTTPTTIAKVLNKADNNKITVIPTPTTVTNASSALHVNLNELPKQQQQQQQVIINNSQQNDNSNNNLQNNKQNNQLNNNNNNNVNNTQNVDLSTDDLIRTGLGLESYSLPNFGTINLENIQLPSNCTMDDVMKFEDLYKKHCAKILDIVVALKFSSLENIWLMFWRSQNVNYSYYEEQLCSEKFFQLCQLNEIVEFVKQCDNQFYQFCIEILIPNVLGSLPPNLVQNIRTLAKNVDNWLRNALTNAPEPIRKTKILIISTFSMTLRRYTSLNHLVQTVRNSLQNENILKQMLNDISRVDFAYIREQAKWACECDETMITKFENDFKESLRNHNTWNLDKWMTWLEDDVANYYLKKFEGTEQYAKMAKKFLLKWSFLCSSVIRDLTLRSATSFGSFHLIRLLYDEYMCYIIEHKIANECKLTPLAVMSTFD